MSPKNSTNSFVVTEAAELMPFLLQKLPQQSRTSIKALLQNGQVWVEGKAIRQFNHALIPTQRVEIQRVGTLQSKSVRGLAVLFEDAHIVVIEKPAGLLSMATNREKEQTAYSQLSHYLKQQNPKNKVFIVHRLDRDTSGVMVFAKTEQAQQNLQQSWNSGTKERVYLAVTEGIPQVAAGKIESYLRESKALVVYSSRDAQNGQYALTHYQTLKTTAAYALLEVRLETGRKNQVRVHLQDLGTPIVGDKKYGATTNPLGRLGLHAWVLAFEHPISGQLLRFETRIPTAFSSFF
jgi:23S rRNA pseudouridine1911/1915/1917 synthase